MTWSRWICHPRTHSQASTPTPGWSAPPLKATARTWCWWATPTSGHGPGGSIPINNKIIGDLTEGNLSPVAGWIVMIVIVALAAAVLLVRDRQRREPASPPRRSA